MYSTSENVKTNSHKFTESAPGVVGKITTNGIWTYDPTIPRMVFKLL